MTAHGTESPGPATLWAAIAALSLLAPTVSAQGPGPGSEILQQSDMIFVGTVRQLGAVATKDVPAADDTAVVMVDRIVTPGDWSPLRGFEGRSVTVRLGGRDRPAAGSSAMFYTRLWVLGQGLALIELAHEKLEAGAGDAAVADAAARTRSYLRTEEDRNLKARMERAALIVSGEVSAVRKLDSAGGADMPRRLSEHDPQWREAVIEVRDVIKGPGGNAMSEVAVRFPGSIDVMWASAPKFQVGQEGIFILMAEEIVPQAEPRRDIGFTGAMTDPANYLSTAEEQRVRRLLGR